jgi:osmotically-inducible protein OsmY
MRLNKTHALLGAALMAFSTYGFGETTADQNGERRLVVTESGVSDVQVRAEVRQQINGRSELRFYNIDVQSFHHDVYLYGLVDTGADSAQAESIARSVPGVGKIYNGLVVNGNGG